jgi:hypothetical protein
MGINKKWYQLLWLFSKKEKQGTGNKGKLNPHK